MMERVSESSLSGVHHGMIGTASKVVVQNVALAGVQLPIVGAAAVLMLQLIDLCDAYKCNMKLFLALKARMQFLYRLYFAEGGKFTITCGCVLVLFNSVCKIKKSSIPFLTIATFTPFK